MRAVAVRHLDARRHADVETRLVVNENDVRRFLRRRAGFVAGRLQMFGGNRVGLHEAVGEQLGNRVDAGAREGRHLVAAIECLERQQRQMPFDRRERGNARQHRRDRGQPADTERIGAPREHHQRHQRADAQRHDPAQHRIDREQEADGVGVDDHQVDEVRRHHQHVVFEIGEQHQHRHHHQRQRAGDGRPAGEREPEEIQDAPGQQKGRDLDRPGFGRDHDAQRDDVRDDGQSQAPSAMAGDKIRGTRPTT